MSPHQARPSLCMNVLVKLLFFDDFYCECLILPSSRPPPSRKCFLNHYFLTFLSKVFSGFEWAGCAHSFGRWGGESLKASFKGARLRAAPSIRLLSCGLRISKRCVFHYFCVGPFLRVCYPHSPIHRPQVLSLLRRLHAGLEARAAAAGCETVFRRPQEFCCVAVGAPLPTPGLNLSRGIHTGSDFSMLWVCKYRLHHLVFRECGRMCETVPLLHWMKPKKFFPRPPSGEGFQLLSASSSQPAPRDSKGPGTPSTPCWPSPPASGPSRRRSGTRCRECERVVRWAIVCGVSVRWASVSRNGWVCPYKCSKVEFGECKRRHKKLAPPLRKNEEADCEFF